MTYAHFTDAVQRIAFVAAANLDPSILKREVCVHSADSVPAVSLPTSPTHKYFLSRRVIPCMSFSSIRDTPVRPPQMLDVTADILHAFFRPDEQRIAAAAAVSPTRARALSPSAKPRPGGKS